MTQQSRLVCDGCGVQAGSFGSYQEWNDAASRLGWLIGEDFVLCGPCAGWKYEPMSGAMEFAVGDEVKVYDGDVGSWLLGVVDDVDAEGIVVRTELEVGGLPLLLGVPSEAFETLVRKSA